jgi:hypothetical protein
VSSVFTKSVTAGEPQIVEPDQHLDAKITPVIPLDFIRYEIGRGLKDIEMLTTASDTFEGLRRKEFLTEADRKQAAELARKITPIVNRADIELPVKVSLLESLSGVIKLGEGKPPVVMPGVVSTNNDPNSALDSLARNIRGACNQLLEKHGKTLSAA